LEKHTFSHSLISWYQRYKRDLPWRHTRDPYLIWLSEVILQQTRVKQGLPYYVRFVEMFPTVQDLARADEREVLRLWQGLGYYSRARNMHLTAKIITEEQGGIFPSQYEELLKLKGIGTYTAAAIASFAFNGHAAVLDGNVFRVLARVFGIETDMTSHEGKKIFTRLANDLLPDTQSDQYNQAIMEFGAMQCTPQTPNCMFCPLNDCCVAHLTGRQDRLPVKNKKTKITHRFFHYFVVQQGERIYMKERRGKDIWSGLYDFYQKEEAALLSLDELSADPEISALLKHTTIEEQSEVFTHVLTHQRIQVRFWKLRFSEDVPPLFLDTKGFFTWDEIRQLPKPILIDNYLNRYYL
jgi:A/G-specific adenine glycosylase